MTTATLTLTDFLLARIAEDERAACCTCFDWGGACQGGWCDDRCPTCSDGDRERQTAEGRREVAECEAKRRIVERTAPTYGANAAFAPSPIVEWILRRLAAVYADHPDYREEWRP